MERYIVRIVCSFLEVLGDLLKIIGFYQKKLDRAHQIHTGTGESLYRIQEKVGGYINQHPQPDHQRAERLFWAGAEPECIFVKDSKGGKDRYALYSP